MRDVIGAWKQKKCFRLYEYKLRQVHFQFSLWDIWWVNRKGQICLLYLTFGKTPVEVGHLRGLTLGLMLSLYFRFSLETHMNDHKAAPKCDSSRWLAPFGRQPQLDKLWPTGTRCSVSLSWYTVNIGGRERLRKYTFWQLNKEAIQTRNAREDIFNL